MWGVHGYHQVCYAKYLVKINGTLFVTITIDTTTMG